ncbi:MAG: hypothetical protein AMXMBFR16_11310 [Candidatus Uhrbacteria bacterium]
MQGSWYLYGMFRNKLYEVRGIELKGGSCYLSLLVDGTEKRKQVAPNYPLVVSCQNLVGHKALPILVAAREVSDMEEARRRKAMLVAETTTTNGCQWYG